MAPNRRAAAVRPAPAASNVPAAAASAAQAGEPRRPRSWAHHEAIAFRKVRRGYVSANNELVSWLSDKLADIDEIDARVTGRTKDVRSVEAKLRARQRQQPGRDAGYADLPDLIGVRVVVRLDSEIAVVASELHRLLIVDKDADVRDERGREETPGYRGRHFDVRVRPDSKLPELLRTQPAEIQVRTRGADLWASIEHELRYKASGELPPARSRQFILAASLLELAERELDDLRSWHLASLQARRAVLDGAASEVADTELDQAGLAAQLARRYPAAPSTPRRLGWMLDLLREMRISTAEELLAALPRRPDPRILALAEGRSSVDTVRMLDDELLLVMPEPFIKANRAVPDERNPQRLATLARRRRKLGAA